MVEGQELEYLHEAAQEYTSQDLVADVDHVVSVLCGCKYKRLTLLCLKRFIRVGCQSFLEVRGTKRQNDNYKMLCMKKLKFSVISKEGSRRDPKN